MEEEIKEPAVELSSAEKLEQLKGRVCKKNLYIQRIPAKTKLRFQELSAEDFDGDYGFTLKFLLDFYDGLISSPNRILIEQMEVMAEEITKLKSVPKEEPKPKRESITSLSGRTIRTGGK